MKSRKKQSGKILVIELYKEMPEFLISNHLSFIFLFFIEKDLKFLRIGSLNVRVKKTTQAFSNFLGVGSTQSNLAPLGESHSNQQPNNNFNNIYKNWGSADNVSQVNIPAQKESQYKLVQFVNILKKKNILGRKYDVNAATKKYIAEEKPRKAAHRIHQFNDRPSKCTDNTESTTFQPQ